MSLLSRQSRTSRDKKIGEKSLVTEKQLNITDKELQAIVQAAVKEALDQKTEVLTAKNLFNDVRLDSREIELINDQFTVAEVLNGCHRSSILTNISFPYGWEKSYSKAHNSEIHNNLKKVVLNIFGKTLNSDLTRDEYELARMYYSELRDWFLSSYERRLDVLENKKDSLPPASK